MNIKAKAAAYGITGLVLAGIVIFSGAAFGTLQSSNGRFNPATTSTLSILLTDPPSVPEGVSAVYITYSDFALHATGLGDAGWVKVNAQGTLDTLGLVNISQTISSDNVPNGRYNLIAFTISSAKVKFLGTNYTATVNADRLLVPVVGGLSVNSSKPAAALIDIQPIVLNLGDQSSPDFVITTGAKALQVPSGEVVSSLRAVGARLPIGERAWFRSFVANHPDILQVASVSLSSSSFSFKVSNPGSVQVTLRLAILTPASSAGGQRGPPASLRTSFVFAIQADGSLQLLKSQGAGSALQSSGFVLAGGASASLSFSGTISSVRPGSVIVAGSTYDLLLFGSQTLSVQTVTAS